MDKDYNSYVSILNENIFTANINKQFIKILKNDLDESIKKMKQLIKEKNYNMKICSKNSKNINSYYFPKEYKKKISLCKHCITYTCVINERNIKIEFNTDNISMNFLYNCFKKICTWLYIVDKYGTGKCSKNLTISFYFFDFLKELPSNNIKIIDVENVNTAYASVCAPNGEIVIYRKEEWFKVFIHETFHAYGLDFGVIESNKIRKNLKHIIDIDSKMYIFETYTETWATMWYICFSVYDTNEELDMENFYNYYLYYLSIEQLHGVIQSIKILNWMNMKYKDLISNNKISREIKKKYKENTNVFNYYILKTVFLLNINDFLYYCKTHNNKLLNFKSTPKEINIFSKLIIKWLISNKVQKSFIHGDKILNDKKINNYYLNKSLRMTIV